MVPEFLELTGQNFRNPQQAAPAFREQLHRLNDYLLQQFIHQQDHRSRLVLDLDSTVVTVFGRQEGAVVDYNPRYRGKRSYDPLLCLEANSSFLWDVELRRVAMPARGRAASSSWPVVFSPVLPTFVNSGCGPMQASATGPFWTCWKRVQPNTPWLREGLAHLKRALGGLRYQQFNPRWEIAEFEHRPSDWPQARRCVVARRLIEETDPEPTLFTLERYAYRAWHTNLPLTPAGVWHFYDGRAGMEPRIRELREDFALRKIPTRAFAANALYLEVVRLAYNLVTAFQRTCLPEEWQSMTLSKLRHRRFWLPGELTRPQHRPTLRLANSPLIRKWAEEIVYRIYKLKPLER
jgi:DDE family transposase